MAARYTLAAGGGLENGELKGLASIVDTVDTTTPLLDSASDGDPMGTPDLQQYGSAEAVLDRLGWKNRRLIWIVMMMASIWGLIALPVMSSAFAVKGITCPDESDEQCQEEKKRFRSINSEFHLDELGFFGGNLYHTSYFIGTIVVGTLLSYVADIVGRRIVVVVCMFATSLFGCLLSIAPSFPVLIAFRTIQGVFYTPVSLVNWVLASECIAIRYHGHASMLFGICWVTGYCATALIAYVFPYWRTMLLVMAVPGVLASVLMWFTIPESFQFLVEKRRAKAVEEWIKRMEHPDNPINCDVDYLIHKVSQTEVDVPESGLTVTFKFLRRHPRYLVFLVASTIMWIFDMFVYNGMSLFSTALVGNPYWNFVLSGLIEVPAYIFSPEVMNRIGRKWTVFGSHMFTAFFCVCTVYLVPNDNKVVYMVFWLLAKLGTSISFLSLFVYGSEIFPTQVRNSCLGVSALFGNVGAMLAMQVQSLTAIYAFLPMLMFAGLSLIGGLITLIFPETLTGHRH